MEKGNRTNTKYTILKLIRGPIEMRSDCSCDSMQPYGAPFRKGHVQDNKLMSL